MRDSVDRSLLLGTFDGVACTCIHRIFVCIHFNNVADGNSRAESRTKVIACQNTCSLVLKEPIEVQLLTCTHLFSRLCADVRLFILVALWPGVCVQRI